MKIKSSAVKLIAAVALCALVVVSAAPFTAQNAWAKKKSVFKLSEKSITISESRDITLTSSKKNEKISIKISNTNVAYVEQKKQSGKKTVFTVIPKVKGTTRVTFKAGKKKAVLKVTVPKTSFQTIQTGFRGQMFLSNATGSNGSVSLMIYNSTGIRVFLSSTATIHGDVDYDGHWFDPLNNSSQFGTQYVPIAENVNQQIEYFNAPVYGLRLDSRYNIMTFHNQASITFTAYFDEVAPENAYSVTVDSNGVTTITKI